jgi:cytochrome c oxidase subunit II
MREAREMPKVSGRIGAGAVVPVVGGVATMLLLSSCASNAPQDTLKPGGPISKSIQSLANPVFYIAIGIGIGVYILVLGASFKFRRRSEDDVPKQVHGNTAMEIGWTVVPAALLAVFGFLSVGKIFDLAEEPKDAYEIAVIGHQWWWEYRYPVVGETKLNATIVRKVNEGKGLEARLETSGAVVVNANELHIPAGVNVRLQIHSGDVLHNYWVPKLSGKIYAVPGKLNKLTIKAYAKDGVDGKPKFIYGQCAEFCGTSHANMRLKVVVNSKNDFDAWLTNQSGGQVGEATLSPVALEGKKLFAGSAGCTACHIADNSAKTNYQVVDPKTHAITGRIGPNLTHFGTRSHFAGAIAETNVTNLKAWLRNPQEFKPGARMVIRKLSEDEVTKLVTYLKELK